MDGAICYYSEDDKFTFLNHAKSLDIANIEMEAAALAAITHQVGIKTAVVCVTLLDRLKGDQVSKRIINQSKSIFPCREMGPAVLQRWVGNFSGIGEML